MKQTDEAEQKQQKTKPMSCWKTLTLLSVSSSHRILIWERHSGRPGVEPASFMLPLTHSVILRLSLEWKQVVAAEFWSSAQLFVFPAESSSASSDLPSASLYVWGVFHSFITCLQLQPISGCSDRSCRTSSSNHWLTHAWLLVVGSGHFPLFLFQPECLRSAETNTVVF